MREARRACALALWAALLAAHAKGAAPATPASDGGVADAGSLDAQTADSCEVLAARVERRKAWLEARRKEQFERGGLPDPSLGIPNMVGVHCEAHPADEQCALGSISLSASPDEFLYRPDATTDDYDPHVILLRRELAACLRARRPWWGEGTAAPER